MLLNVAAHNVSIRNVKVSKRERHIMYSITKRTTSQKVQCTLHNCYKTFSNGIRFVTLYVMWRLHFENFTFWNSYIVCSHVWYHYVMWRLRYVALRYVATSKKWFLSSQKYDTGFPSRIRIPELDPDFLLILDPYPGSQIPNPGIKKGPDPWSQIPDPDSQHRRFQVCSGCRG